jgi:hypothetical protein
MLGVLYVPNLSRMIDTTSEEFIFPEPDAEGITQMQELYYQRTGKEITELEAKEALGRVMRYLFLLNIPEAPLHEENKPHNHTA